MKKILLILLFPLISYNNVSAQDNTIIIDSIKVNNEELYIDFHIDSLLDDKVIEGLKRGLTVSITYQIELWMERNNWFDRIVDGGIMWLKLSYNKLENRYIFENIEERRSTGKFEKALKKCSEIENFYITKIKKLKTDNIYYIVIKETIKPLSVENINEIGQWLKGEVENVDLNKIKKPRETGRSLRNYLLEIIANIAGFGDRYFSTTSRKFTIDKNTRIIYKE